MIETKTKENELTKVTGTEPTKKEIEKFIKEKYPAPIGTVLRICWMDKWDYYYRLNYWEILPKKDSFYSEERIVDSKFVMIEHIGHDWVTREYED